MGKRHNATWLIVLSVLGLMLLGCDKTVREVRSPDQPTNAPVAINTANRLPSSR